MKPPSDLPEEYQPFKELVICSNRFINGEIPILVNNYSVLLVGKGDIPAVWLASPPSPKSIVLVHYINNNEAIRQGYKVLPLRNAIIVTYENTVLLHVEKVSEEKAEIWEMDLRPIGLNIHGDKNGLFVGTSQLVRNTFENVRTMIAIGESP